MAKQATNTVFMWAGVAFGALFILPRAVAAIRSGAAAGRAQTLPASAAELQAARAINTAGTVGNSALANMLSRLLAPSQQRQAGAAKSSGGGGGGNAPGPSAGSRGNDLSDLARFLNAGGVTPYSEIVARGDYLRVPTALDKPQTIDASWLIPPSLDYGAVDAQRSDDLSFLGLGGSEPVLAAPDSFEVYSAADDGGAWFDNFDSIFFMPDVVEPAPYEEVYGLLDSGDYYSNPYESFGMVEALPPDDYAFDDGGGYVDDDYWY